MTVKIMAGEAAARNYRDPVQDKPREVPLESERSAVTAPKAEKPVVYIPEQYVRERAAPEHNVPEHIVPGQPEYVPRSYSRKRRRNMSFGDIVFVQLLVSALLAAGLWAGSTFGGDEIRAVCERVTGLLR